MSTQKPKPEAFNPLDILATAAAALKQVDKGQEDKGQGDKGHEDNGQEETMTQSSPSNSQDNHTDNNKDTKTNDGNNGVHVRKFRVLKLTPDIEKMLDEHNYGNSRKNYGKSSWSETSVKDRKVIVTVVNGTGDHAVKPIDCVDVGPSGDEASGDRKKMDNKDDQVTCTGDTSNLPEADHKGSETSAEISPISGDHSAGTQINDSTESSSHTTLCMCTDKTLCSCVNKNINTAPCLSSDETSSVSMSTPTVEEQECSCDKPDKENVSETESSGTCGGTDNEPKCESIDPTPVVVTPVVDSGELDCDTDSPCCDDDSSSSNNGNVTSCHLETSNTTVNTGSSNKTSHIRMVSHTMPNPETKLHQPQTLVININHNKQTVQSDIGLSCKEAEDSQVTGSLSKDQHIETDIDNGSGETDISSSDRISSADLQTNSALPGQPVAGGSSPETSTLVKQDQVLASEKATSCSSVGVARENGDDEDVISRKGLPEMEGDKLCKKPIASTSSLENVESPECVDNPEHNSDKLMEEELFKESIDNSAFDDSTFSNSSSKIFLKTQPCSESNQISSCLKLVQSGRNDETSSPASADHCYAGISEPVTELKPVRKSMRLQSADSLVSDLSQDSGFVEVSPGTPSGNKMFPNRLSDTPVDQKMETGSSDSSPENLEIKNIKNFLVTSSSAGVLSQDLSDVNKARDAIIALMQQSSSPESGETTLHPVPVTPVKSNKVSVPNKNVSPKVGKYRIGTFGSVSNSAMGLESPKKKQSPQVLTSKQSSKDIVSCTKSLLGKINGTGRSVMPCVVTCANNGAQLTVKDMSASKEYLETWKGHVEHDHDYCLPPEAESSSPHLMAKLLKDTSMKNVIKCSGRDKRAESNESSGSTGSKRPRRVSVSGRPDLPRNGNTELSSPNSLSSSPVDFPVVQPHMTARQRAKAEKAAEYVKMGNSDSKLKITGKFQDDYIYFLNTKVRSRRRTNSQDLPPQIPLDRIVVPTPKPGDIVVPHLTDADLEAIRLGKHASIKSAASSSGLGGLSVSASTSSSFKQIQPSLSIPMTSSPVIETSKSGVVPTSAMSDEESKIINTILSMETGESTSTTTSSSIAPDMGTEVPSLSLPTPDTFSFLPEQMNLTPEQYEILYSAMDEVQGFEDLGCGPSSPTSQSELSEDTTTPTEPLRPQDRLGEANTTSGLLQAKIDTPTVSMEVQNVPVESSLKVQSPITATSLPESLEPLSENKQKLVFPSPVSEPSSQDLKKCEDKPLTVKSLLQANGAAKSLLQAGSTVSGVHTGQELALTNGTVGPATSVKSLLKTDHQSKSLLTSDIPGSSAVSSIQDLPFTSLDKSSAQDLPFTSLEKSSLDLFENDLKLFPDATVPESSSPASIAPAVPPTPQAPPPTDYSAPWIVTVSMFWNDLPAIMIDNLPFVRLVDIHKQILPAKDTGILKKRCQLLGINVGNCSEMQRYFLVQYGKAFNSKSTLIVGKNDAKMLIGYYVNPVPKTARGEESLVGRSLEEQRVGTPRLSKVRGGAKVKDHNTEPSPRAILEVPPSLPVPVMQAEDSEILVRPLPLQDVTVTRTAVSASASLAVDSVSQSTSQPGRVSHRTRHKKINFLEMLKGDANNNTSLVDNVTPQGSVPVTEESMGGEGSLSSMPTPPEESIPKEKLLKRNVNVKNVRNSSSKIKDKIVNRDRTKVKKGKDPVPAEEQSMGESECENRAEEEEEEEAVEGISDKLPFFIGKRGAKNNDREQMAKKLKIMKNRKPGALKVKWKIFGKSNSAKRVMFNKGNNSKAESRSEILAVIHKDMVPRNGHKHRMQAGNVFLDQYNRKDSTCVRCCTCKKLLSVDMFLIHLHEIGGSGKLLSVSQPQVISLRDSYPSETQKRLWENFQKRRRLHSNSSNDRSKNSVVESEEKLPDEILSMPSKKVEQRKKVVSEKLANPAKVPLRHTSVPAIQAPVTLSNGNVRISARKRKQKQLYPIENYSFSRKSHQKNLQIDSDGDEPLSPNGVEVNVDEGGSPPSKVIRLLPSVLDSGTSVGVERVVPQVSQGSVLTLANGPEVISFTALQEDEAIDMV